MKIYEKSTNHVSSLNKKPFFALGFAIYLSSVDLPGRWKHTVRSKMMYDSCPNQTVVPSSPLSANAAKLFDSSCLGLGFLFLTSHIYIYILIHIILYII